MNSRPTFLFDSLASLFEYPEQGYPGKGPECREMLSKFAPQACQAFDEFILRIEKLSQTELQELYTSTFDLNPVCSLEVGWHLYGEQYERGRLLVKIRQQLRQLNVSETTELPDHFSQILRALGRMPAETAARWTGEVVQPALARMRQGFQKQSDNPFALLLEAVDRTLQPLAEISPAEVTHD